MLAAQGCARCGDPGVDAESEGMPSSSESALRRPSTVAAVRGAVREGRERGGRLAGQPASLQSLSVRGA